MHRNFLRLAGNAPKISYRTEMSKLKQIAYTMHYVNFSLRISDWRMEKTTYKLDSVTSDSGSNNGWAIRIV